MTDLFLDPYSESYPPSLWAPVAPPPVVDPLDKTSAWPAAGTAANLAALKAHATIGDSGTAKPTAAFTEGQYVKLADGSKASWDGTAWVAGAAPAAPAPAPPPAPMADEPEPEPEVVVVELDETAEPDVP
jgi:hypothetical protein